LKKTISYCVDVIYISNIMGFEAVYNFYAAHPLKIQCKVSTISAKENMESI